MSDNVVIAMAGSVTADADKDKQILLLKQRIVQLTSDEAVISNGWTSDNIRTIDTWIDTASRLSFTYDLAADIARQRLERIGIVMLLVSSIATLVSFLQLNLDATEHPDTASAFKIILAAMSTVTSFITGYTSIRKIQDKVNNYSKYVEKANQIAAICSAQIGLPPSFRIEANKFIMDYRDKYQALLVEKPDMTQNDFQTGEDAYNKNIYSGRSHCKLLAISQLRQHHKSTSPPAPSPPPIRESRAQDAEQPSAH